MTIETVVLKVDAEAFFRNVPERFIIPENWRTYGSLSDDIEVLALNDIFDHLVSDLQFRNVLCYFISIMAHGTSVYGHTLNRYQYAKEMREFVKLIYSEGKAARSHWMENVFGWRD
jgi:hypothetical protein